MDTDIVSTVASWLGVEVEPHRFAGSEFTLGGREFGHIHGTHQVDIPFAKRVRDVVVEQGLTAKHHLFPDSGWVTTHVDSEADAERAVWLLRLSYLSHVAALQRCGTVAAVDGIDVANEVDALDPPAAIREFLTARSTDTTESTTAAGR